MVDIGHRLRFCETWQPDYALLVGIPNDRHDQPVFERDRDAQIDIAIVKDVGPIDRSIQNRELSQRHACGFQNERQECQ